MLLDTFDSEASGPSFARSKWRERRCDSKGASSVTHKYFRPLIAVGTTLAAFLLGGCESNDSTENLTTLRTMLEERGGASVCAFTNNKVLGFTKEVKGATHIWQFDVLRKELSVIATDCGGPPRISGILPGSTHETFLWSELKSAPSESFPEYHNFMLMQTSSDREAAGNANEFISYKPTKIAVDGFPLAILKNGTYVLCMFTDSEKYALYQCDTAELIGNVPFELGNDVDGISTAFGPDHNFVLVSESTSYAKQMDRLVLLQLKPFERVAELTFDFEAKISGVFPDRSGESAVLGLWNGRVGFAGVDIDWEDSGTTMAITSPPEWVGSDDSAAAHWGGGLFSWIEEDARGTTTLFTGNAPNRSAAAGIEFDSSFGREFSEDGSMVAVSHADNLFEIWRISSTESVCVYRGRFSFSDGDSQNCPTLRIDELALAELKS